MAGMNENLHLIELLSADISHIDSPDAILLRDVNWRIQQGEFWVVGGRAASGKSSLLLTAAGLNRPAGGALRIFGEDLAQAKEKDQITWRHRIGFVFESGGRPFHRLSVAENIGLPLRYHWAMSEASIAARVDELLTLTDLRAYAQDLPGRVNLAVQQRAALARALTTTDGSTSSPKLLFADNPLSALSLRDCRWWLDFLRQLRESYLSGGETMTIIASANDFRAWADVATHFAAIENGRFIIVGGRDQLASSTDSIVRELLAAGT